MAIEMSVNKSYTIRIDASTRDALLNALNAWQLSARPIVDTSAKEDSGETRTLTDQYNCVRRFAENLTAVDEHGVIKSA